MVIYFAITHFVFGIHTEIDGRGVTAGDENGGNESCEEYFFHLVRLGGKDMFLVGNVNKHAVIYLSAIL